MRLSIVIPCYNSTNTIGDVVDLTQQVIDEIDDVECEFILVNDGSPDGTTFDSIRALAGKYPNVKGIDLARNFGQHNAIMAGLHEVSGDLVMGMDDDMQTHPSQIPVFLDKIKEGYDVVFGIYRKRQFNAWKNLVSKVASNIIWKSVGRPKGLESSNFWCCRRYVIDEVIRDNGYNLYLEIMFFRTTNRIANVSIEHFARAQGTSNYTFRKGLKLFMSFINYTVLPLRLITYVGGISAMVGFISALVIVVRKILDPTIPVGWSSLMCVILVLFGITFLGLGILGEYVGNMVINQNKQPQFVVRETVNVSPGGAEQSPDEPGS
ncbi:MAG: glycosyltransferase family 2 protein [Lachnospiraceae bacterium]|nr:glycosyltransferase family 2 protein [Lachnospiraceae bacterium]